jgi:hypothetical protein
MNTGKLTCFYYWIDDTVQVGIFGADDDSGLTDDCQLEKADNFKAWFAKLTNFQGLAVVVLDSVIFTEGLDSRRPMSDGAFEWCQKQSIETAVEEGIVVVLSAGGGNAVKPIHRWYVKSEIPIESLWSIRDLAIATQQDEITFDDWPIILEDPVGALSTAIHALYNLPVRLDAETADQIAQMSGHEAKTFLPDCVAMWEATLGAIGTRPILTQIEKIADRRNVAGKTIDHYLGEDLSLHAMIKGNGIFYRVVEEQATKLEGVSEDLAHIIEEDGIDVEEEGQKATRRRMLADGLKILATDLDGSVIEPLKKVRQHLVEGSGK